MTTKITNYLNSEYKPVKAVLLYKPRPEISKITNAVSILYNQPIDFRIMDQEFNTLIELYKRLNISVYLIDDQLDIKNTHYLYNMMYVRDLVFMTPLGAIISRMKYDVRQDEVICVENALLNIGIPIIHKIYMDGTLEGADVLWLNEKTVLIGVGNRTNGSGYNQVREVLNDMGVECIPVSVPQGIQHLLGVVQFVDCQVALVRTELVDKEIIRILTNNQIKIVSIPENIEVRERQAMNVVTVEPRKVIMPSHCAETEKIYKQNNIEVIACIKISQLINGAGGLACATAILSRSQV